MSILLKYPHVYVNFYSPKWKRCFKVKIIRLWYP